MQPLAPAIVTADVVRFPSSLARAAAGAITDARGRCAAAVTRRARTEIAGPRLPAMTLFANASRNRHDGLVRPMRRVPACTGTAPLFAASRRGRRPFDTLRFVVAKGRWEYPLFSGPTTLRLFFVASVL
jgi:hypothetical protein